MQREVTTRPGLSDAKAYMHPIGEGGRVSRLRKRWIMLLAIGTFSLSILFVWGFLHLILVLMFPKPVIAH